MQLDYLHNPTRALEFVQTLCLDDAEEILREQQGKRIISALPRRGTEVFIKLCVRWCGPARRLSDGSQPSKEPGLKHPNRSDAKQFLHVFADFPVCLLHFLRSVVESGVLDGEDPGKEVVLYNTLLELYITRELKHDIREGAVASDPAEMFAVEPYEQRRQQALAFLAEFSGRYDAYHALLLAQQHNFEEGVFLLLRRQRHSTELLQYHAKGLEDSVPSMIRQAVKDRLIDFCLSSASDGETGGDAATGAEGDSKGGKSARELWMSLLSMLACGSESDSGDIGRVLSHIAAQDALSPLSVLTTLSSSNADLQLHTFRDYVLGMMQREEARRESIERRTDARLKELQDLHDELDTMQTEAIILQAYNCSHCGAALDLPAVYFACHHSFHRRCLSDVTKCNLCSGAIARARDINQWQQPQRRVKGDFFQYLNSVKYEEGFEMVVEQFGSGIFGPREDPHSPSGVAASAVALACDDSVYDESGELLKPEAVERW
uniref:Uncharacterized protein TCIL3000_8_7270 n=1 Tax=Trypanosoma congolense (strain IL3000) TaxID=1068625 RepID=G0USY5_TRYCI|nr:unnamed protein product [Trypanosoma congolense IL3000]